MKKFPEQKNSYTKVWWKADLENIFFFSLPNEWEKNAKRQTGIFRSSVFFLISKINKKHMKPKSIVCSLSLFFFWVSLHLFKCVVLYTIHKNKREWKAIESFCSRSLSAKLSFCISVWAPNRIRCSFYTQHYGVKHHFKPHSQSIGRER